MAQRRSPGLALAIFAPQAEKGRPRPAGTGNQPGYLRERAVMLAAVAHAMLEHGHVIGDAVPLPDQYRSGLGLEDRDRRHGWPIATPTSGLCQPPSGRPTQPAKRGFLEAIGQRPQEETAAQPGRRLAPVEAPVAHPQVFTRERGE